MRAGVVMTGQDSDMVHEDDLEHTACPLCSCPEKRIAYHLTNPYRVAQCKMCGFHFLDPRLDEEHIATYYIRDYFTNEQVGYGDYSFQEKSLRLTFRRLLKTLHDRGLTGGTLLEIGAGYGYLLDEARDYFRCRTGTELSASASEHASRFADLLVHGGVDDLDVNSKYDCIIMSQVIEHVYRPGEFMEKIKRHLLPGGTVIIITPDFGSFWRKIMGASWPSFKVPEHVLYFDHDSLERLLISAGFATISSFPYPHAFPLKLVSSKLKMTLPAMFDAITIWLPRTCVAVCARAYD